MNNRPGKVFAHSHAEHLEYWRARARELVTVNEARRAEKKPSKQIRIEPEELLELLAPWSARLFGKRPPA